MARHEDLLMFFFFFFQANYINGTLSDNDGFLLNMVIYLVKSLCIRGVFFNYVLVFYTQKSALLPEAEH